MAQHPVIMRYNPATSLDSFLNSNPATTLLQAYNALSISIDPIISLHFLPLAFLFLSSCKLEQKPVLAPGAQEGKEPERG